MKFRSYQLFNIIAIAVLVASLFMGPVFNIYDNNTSLSALENFRLVQLDGEVSYVVCALGVILIFDILLNVFALFISLFQNFELQKRVAILSMLVVAGYYIVLLAYVLILLYGASFTPAVSLLFPFVALVMNLLAFLATRRTEAAILAKASGFRLRD